MSSKPTVTAEQADLIAEYYRKKQDFIDAQNATPEDVKLRTPKDHRVADSETQGKNSLAIRDSKMPAQPKEEETQTQNITDQVAKESDDSTASSHELHQQAHSANLGPVKVNNLPEPTSKEENRKRAEELNK